MPNYPGVLSIVSNQSSLNSDLLLMAGIPDTAQAMFAATQFLIKARHLQSGQAIVVTGQRGTISSVSIIVMSDAQPAGQPFDATHFNVMESALDAAPPVPKAKRAKAGSAKKAAVDKRGSNAAG